MMNGKKIPDEQITSLFELADRAPTHGLTEPWRFIVYADPAAFCSIMPKCIRAKLMLLILMKLFIIILNTRATKHRM
jgi:nitroreductase